MREPRIGMPLCLDARGRWRAGRRYHYVDAAYADAIESAGGVAVYLPLRAEAEPLLEGIDGLLLPGGDDLPPPRAYPADVALDCVPEPQLAFDRRLLNGTLERRLPVLAVCYGMQLLAGAYGGSLHYHLPTDLPGATNHRLPEPSGRHGLHVEPGSRLAEFLGGSCATVNSLHHQAVAEPGAGLRVSARAPDGVIEALEREEEPFCVGVQWHPEKLDDDGSRRLFAAFVAACARAG